MFFVQDVEDGTITSPKDFIKECSKSYIFTYGDEYTDDGELIKPESDYNETCRNQYIEDLALLHNMSDEEIHIAAEKYNKDKLDQYYQWIDDNHSKIARISTMLTKIESWVPPTSNNKDCNDRILELKDSMIEDLNREIKKTNDSTRLYMKYSDEYEPISDINWYDNRISIVSRMLSDVIRTINRDKLRHETNKEFIKLLKENLKDMR